MQLSSEASLLTLPSRILMRSLSFEFSSFKRLISLKRESKKIKMYYYPTALRRVQQISCGICTPEDQLDRFVCCFKTNQLA